MKFVGELEIDTRRGVAWFNDASGQCRLRVCRLGHLPADVTQIDVTHMVGVTVEHGSIDFLSIANAAVAAAKGEGR